MAATAASSLLNEPSFCMRRRSVDCRSRTSIGRGVGRCVCGSCDENGLNCCRPSVAGASFVRVVE